LTCGKVIAILSRQLAAGRFGFGWIKIGFGQTRRLL
jgi:hypothetical protein